MDQLKSASCFTFGRTPRLAVFWGYKVNAVLEPIGQFVPVVQVPLLAGFKTIELGHVDLWLEMQREWPELRHLEYDEVPRGRVNWREEDETFLILLDRRLWTEGFLKRLHQKLELDDARIVVLEDSHYR